MYTTEIYQGTAFQSYVPKPIHPSFTAGQAAVIERLQSRVAKVESNAFAFRTAMVEAVLRHEGSTGLAQSRRRQVNEAVDFALGCGTFDVKSLKAVNAILVGQASVGFRTAPIWIAAAHPSLSTHVGSPARRLQPLVSQILAAQSRPGPIGLRALVAMVRLLQVHPFADGNGRTARLLACWWMADGLGKYPAIPIAISGLWRGGTIGINQMCVAIRDFGDWDPLLDAFVALAQNALDAGIPVVRLDAAGSTQSLFLSTRKPQMESV
jgi:hypothetical protein